MNVCTVHNVQKGCPILVTGFFSLIETWFSALKINLKNFNLQHKIILKSQHKRRWTCDSLMGNRKSGNSLNSGAHVPLASNDIFIWKYSSKTDIVVSLSLKTNLWIWVHWLLWISDLMDKGITRIFLEILGISVCCGQILILHVHPSFLPVSGLGEWSRATLGMPLKMRGGRSASRLVVALWREGVDFKQDLMELGAGLFKTGEKILCIDNSVYEP